MVWNDVQASESGDKGRHDLHGLREEIRPETRIEAHPGSIMRRFYVGFVLAGRLGRSKNLWLRDRRRLILPNLWTSDLQNVAATSVVW
jgi:hypothetical protein